MRSVCVVCSNSQRRWLNSNFHVGWSLYRYPGILDKNVSSSSFFSAPLSLTSLTSSKAWTRVRLMMTLARRLTRMPVPGATMTTRRPQATRSFAGRDRRIIDELDYIKSGSIGVDHTCEKKSSGGHSLGPSAVSGGHRFPKC